MERSVFDMPGCDIAWCPGCGNFGILNIMKDVLAQVEVQQEKTVFVSGIGQAAKAPQYMKVNFFNGLHGRALPAATGIKASNPELTVIVESGDGDMYGEGGNHLLHCIRRNPDITAIVHNNMVYGLTKGQASPTSGRKFNTPVQVDGVTAEPFNPLAVAIALNASFVARIFMQEKELALEVIKKAIKHKGFALIDCFQPCVTFNKVNTYKWFKENTYILDEKHDPGNRLQAFEKAIETEKLPLGIFYINENKASFSEQLAVYKNDRRPLFQREPSLNTLDEFTDSLR
jgi:2-oxoglutarate ferredoxin oxidoreductase subunit beta